MPGPANAAAMEIARQDLAGTLMPFDLAMDRAGFIGLKVLPVFSAGKPFGRFPKVDLAYLLENRETRRAPHAGYSRSDWKFTTDDFETYEDGAEEVIDDKEAAIYADYFDFETISTERARDVILRNHEKRVADMLFNETNFTATSVTNEWDDATNATPIDDIEAAVRRVWARTGLWPNALIINRHVFRNLRNSAQVISRIQSAGAGDATKATDINEQMLASVFDIDYVFVGDGVRNTGGKGDTAAFGKLWSDEYAMVARVATSSDLREPALGRTFHWAGDGSVLGGTVEEYRESRVRGSVIRVRHEVGEKLIFSGAGDLLKNITT